MSMVKNISMCSLFAAFSFFYTGGVMSLDNTLLRLTQRKQDVA